MNHIVLWSVLISGEFEISSLRSVDGDGEEFAQRLLRDGAEDDDGDTGEAEPGATDGDSYPEPQRSSTVQRSAESAVCHATG